MKRASLFLFSCALPLAAQQDSRTPAVGVSAVPPTVEASGVRGSISGGGVDRTRPFSEETENRSATRKVGDDRNAFTLIYEAEERRADRFLEPISLRKQESNPVRQIHSFRLSLVAFGAASVADTASSWSGREMNPILGTGRFSGRQAAIKASITAGLVVAEVGIVRRYPAMRKSLTVGNWVAASAIGAVAVRNLQVAK